MVTKSDIVTTFNEIFESEKEYKDLSIYEKLYSLLVLTAGSGGSGGTTDTVTIRDKTTSTNKLAVDTNGLIGINNLTALAKTVDITALGTKLDNLLTELDTKASLTDTQPVSLNSIPLATNAATSTNQATTNTALSSIDTKLTTVNTRTLTSTDVVSSVQSGTWNLANITGTISLPTGAATESTLSSLSNKLPSVLVSDRLKVTAIFDTAQPITLATLPSLATGSNAIGSITNTGFKVINGSNELAINASGQLTISNSSFNIGNFPSTQVVSGTVAISNSFALDTTTTAISNKLPSSLGSKTAANSLAVTLSSDGTFATAFGTASDSTASSNSASTGFISLFKRSLDKLDLVPININKYGNSSTVSFSASTTSATFTLVDKYLIAVIPAISGAPTITLQVTLDGGTTYADTSVVINTSATVATVIESDLFNRVIACIGLTNALRFKSSTSITATINLRNSHG